jgi:hypothetical protein
MEMSSQFLSSPPAIIPAAAESSSSCADDTPFTATPSGQQSGGGGGGGAHEERLQGMKKQFQILERAFHTLEGLCREEIQSIEIEQKRLDAHRNRSIARLHNSSNVSSSASPQHLRSHDNKLIKLNVGGVRMVVTQGTLLKYPGSIFELLLENLPDANSPHDVSSSCAFPLTLDEEGHIFLDRDADLFRELLHFLRTGDSTTIRMLPSVTRRRVMEEAKYFGFDQLLMELRSTRLEWACETPLSGGVIGDIPAPRCFAAAQYVGNGVVYLFGGCTANDLFFDTLYLIRCCPTDYSTIDVASNQFHSGDGSPYSYQPDSDLSDPAQELSSPAPPYMASYGAAGGIPSQHLQHVPTTGGGYQRTHVYGGDGGHHFFQHHHQQHLQGYRGDSGSPSPIALSAAGAAGGSTTTAGVGGVGGGAALPRPERYEFTLVRPRGDVFPPARSGHAMVHLQGYLVLLYGNDKGGHVHDVFAFNTFTQSWTVLSPRGDYVEPRSGHSVNVVNDRLYLIGGKQIFPAMKSFGDVFEGFVDFENDVITWRMITPVAVLPEGAVVEKRGYHSTALYGEHQIVIHGGIVKDVYCNDVCIYDVAARTWQVISAGDVVPGGGSYVPCQPRSGHIAVIHKDAMYVCGSYSEEHAHMILHSLCLRTFVWRRVHVGGKQLPARRAAPSGVLLPQNTTFALMPRLLMFGGFDITTRKCFNDVYTVTL